MFPLSVSSPLPFSQFSYAFPHVMIVNLLQFPYLHANYPFKLPSRSEKTAYIAVHTREILQILQFCLRVYINYFNFIQAVLKNHQIRRV